MVFHKVRMFTLQACLRNINKGIFYGSWGGEMYYHRKDIFGYEFFKSPSTQIGLQPHPLPKTSLTLMEYNLPKDIY